MVNICRDTTTETCVYTKAKGTLPGVLLGVFDELSDTLADLPGDKPFKADVFDELAFLCHLAMGAFVMGISSFRILWMSFSNPNCAILSTCSHDLYNGANK